MRFTEYELEEMYRKQLFDLAYNLGLDINRRTKKGELIERLLEYVPEEEEPPPMSVRIRRIYESSKGE